MCGQADKNVQLPVRPRGLIDVRRKFNLLLCPIVICRLTLYLLLYHIQQQFLHYRCETFENPLLLSLLHKECIFSRFAIYDPPYMILRIYFLQQLLILFQYSLNISFS